MDDRGDDVVVEISRAVVAQWDWTARPLLSSPQAEGVRPGAMIDEARDRAFAGGNTLVSLVGDDAQVLLSACGDGADDYFVWHDFDASGTIAQVAIDLRMVGWMTGRFSARP